MRKIRQIIRQLFFQFRIFNETSICLLFAIYVHFSLPMSFFSAYSRGPQRSIFLKSSKISVFGKIRQNQKINSNVDYLFIHFVAFFDKLSCQLFRKEKPVSEWYELPNKKWNWYLLGKMKQKRSFTTTSFRWENWQHILSNKSADTLSFSLF